VIAERNELKKKVSLLDGGLEAEKQQRVELLARQSMRRIMNQEIAMCFAAWVESHESDARRRRLL